MKRRFWQQLSLRHKLVWTSIACLTLPTLVMLYVASLSTERIIREQTLDNASQSLRIVQSQLHGLLDEMVSASNQIQFDSELLTLLIDGAGDPLASRTIATRLDNLAGGRTDMVLSLYLDDGRYYSNASYYEFDPDWLKRQTWFPRLDELSAFDTLFVGGQPQYLPSRQKEQPYVIVAARSLTDSRGGVLAYLVVSRAENTFSDLFGNVTEELYMLDSSGRIIAHRDKAKIGLDMMADFAGGGAADERPGAARFTGADTLYVSLPMKQGGWTLASVASYERLTNKVTGIYRSGLTIQLIAAALFLLVIAYSIRQITRPIQRLGATAARVEAGDLDVRSGVRSGDEIGRLGRSFDQMLDQVQLMLEQVKLEQEHKRQAEIAFLQAQIHPHFLFNVLNSIRMSLLMGGDAANAQRVGSLSALLRATVLSRQESVPLQVEIEAVKQYMELMNFTVRHPVTLTVEAGAEAMLETVPRFTLQPLIENAYKHGFARQPGTISIEAAVGAAGPVAGGARAAREVGRVLRLVVRDDGAGMDGPTLQRLQESFGASKRQIIGEAAGAAALSSASASVSSATAIGTATAAATGMTSAGIGLTNVYERLKLIYGDGFTMQITSEPGGGTEAVLTIPLPSGMEVDGHV